MRRHVKLSAELIKSEQIASECSIGPIKNEILTYLQTLEGSSTTLNSLMIDNQPEIDWSMRPYILDFIMELHLFFKLSQETFFLACFITDKYCCKRIVYKRHYQLLAATSLWIASKYQDNKSRIPTLKEFVVLCHQIYEPKMFVQMERHILRTFEWSIGSLISTFDVVQWIISTSSKQVLPKSDQFSSFTSFLCDLTLYQREFMDYSSSVKAISVILIACKVIHNESFARFLNQSIKNQLKWNKVEFDRSDDHCFHIAGDSLTNDLSLSLNAENLQSIRRCIYRLIMEISKDKYCDNSMVNQRTIFKKYNRWPIINWLNNFRKENFDVVSQIRALSNSLELTRETSSSDIVMTNWIWDLILSAVDRLMGLKSGCDLIEDDNEMMHDCQYAPDFIETDTLISSPATLNSSTLPNFQSSNMFAGPIRHTKINGFQSSHYCPPTPYSSNSTFSIWSHLSNGSSVSSVSSVTSPPFFKKTSR